MFNSCVLNVFISTPSDTTEETEKIKSSIKQWNLLNSERERIILNVVSFQENAHPTMIGGRPQEAVNHQLLKSADILIGVFWQRIGTPTTDETGHQYISGSAEEIERHINAGKPAMLFFSRKPLPQEYDREQFEKLQEFKRQYRSRGLICEFNDKESPFLNQISLLMNGNEIKTFLQPQMYEMSFLPIPESKKTQFEWYFEHGVSGKRLWYKDNKYRWREKAEGIEDKCFLCVEDSFLHDVKGVIVQSMSLYDKRGFQIFIPDKGSRDMRLYWRIVHEANNTWQVIGVGEITYRE